MNTNQALVRLLYAALFDAESEQIPQTDYAQLFSVSKNNAVANIVACGIRKSGIEVNEMVRAQFDKESDKALFVYAMQSQQVSILCDVFERAEIPFVLLKGTRMRDFYPNPSMRTSSDIDILVRADDEKLKQTMEQAGYKFLNDEGNTINFMLGAAVEVELHTNLFEESVSCHAYFDAIWDRVQPVDGTHYQYVMSEEDFYATMIAHFAKHFTRYGCGIRNAIDVAVYLRNAPATFDRTKADAILKDIGLLDFERKLRHLQEAWGTETWSETDQTLTDYILGCGVFGTLKSRNLHEINRRGIKHGKTKRVLQHVFPNFKTMSSMYPVLKKCPILLPFCWIARSFRLIFSDHSHIKQAMIQVSEINDASVKETSCIMREMHLDQ